MPNINSNETREQLEAATPAASPLTVPETNPSETVDQPPQQAPPPTQPALQFDSRAYHLLEELGRGGMGEVYRAGDPALGRDLAIKIMKAELLGYAEAERRFLREARITGLLQHPGIVPIYNLGRLADGRLHYTMRLVRGQTFADTLQAEAGRPERLPTLLGIFEKICQTVAYAHSKHVIHRDLKPSNIMVGRFGEVQVMDWGLAKVLAAEDALTQQWIDVEDTLIHTEAADTSSNLTRAGSSMGTPAYMSPEQALGELDVMDERTDVFALGAILCEILTGKPPYTGRDGNEVLRHARRGNLTEARERLDKCGADEALTVLCRECLAPDRDHRPRDAGAIAKRVADYHAEVQDRLRRAELERVEAQTRAREEQARALVERERARAERRAKRRMLALLLTMIAFLILGAFTSWWIVKERETRAKEEMARQTAEVLSREASSYWRRGKDLYEKGLLKEAAAEFREAIRIKEDYSPAHNFLGVVLSDLGQADEAIASYRRSIECDPDFSYPVNNLGAALKKKGDLDGAIDCFKRAIAIEPKNAQAHDNLGDVLYEKGQVDEALAAYRQAVRFDPHEALYFSDLAKCFARKGQLDEAIAACRDAVRLEPEEAIYHTRLANVLAEKGETAEAVSEYRKAIQLFKEAKGDPKSINMANLLSRLGATLLKQQNYAEAEPLLRECLTIRAQKQPEDWMTFDVRSLLGAALLGHKKYAQAEPLLVQGCEGLIQRAAKIPPQDKTHLTQALERLVRLYEATDQVTKAAAWRKKLEEAPFSRDPKESAPTRSPSGRGQTR